MTDLEALAKLAQELTEGCAPGPWHGVRGGQGSWWLDNAAGDSSFPDPDDVATMLNALPALVRVALAAKEYRARFTSIRRIPIELDLSEAIDTERDVLFAALADLDR